MLKLLKITVAGKDKGYSGVGRDACGFLSHRGSSGDIGYLVEVLINNGSKK